MRLARSLTTLTLSVGLVGSLMVAFSADPAMSASDAGRGAASTTYLKTTPDKLPTAGAGWTYNWHYRVPASTPGLDVVPMIRTASILTDDVVRHLVYGRAAGAYRYLLGFNEPDSRNQANLTPTQAANLWPKLQRTGLKLGSPAPAVPTNGWLENFMSLVKKRGLRVDFIALHFYADITDLDRALARIKSRVELIRRTYGKPIWITELGIIDRRANPGTAAANWIRAVTFMRKVTTMLDSKSYVQRYAWMADNVSTRSHLKWSSLYDAYGRLTPLGVAYSKLG